MGINYERPPPLTLTRRMMPKRINRVTRLKRFEHDLKKRSTPQLKGIFSKKIVVKQALSPRGRSGNQQYSQAPIPTQPLSAQSLLLDSTVIAGFKYSVRARILTIYFHSGHQYEYYNVPQAVVYKLAEAQSKGRFFYYNVRMNYEYARIR